MKFMDKIWGLLGLVETEEAEPQPEPEKPSLKKDRSGERKPEKAMPVPPPRPQATAPVVTAIPAATPGTNAVVISHPHGFDDARQIADHLTSNRTVMVNFENTDSETTKRTVDFMSGITYAVGGSVQRVAGTIFMFVPARVEVVTMAHNHEDGRGVLPWSRS